MVMQLPDEESQRQSIWDWRFILLAEHISQWSKDPSTKTGAVIVDENRRIVSCGYNGLPIGVEDDDALLMNREWKYARIIHCEENAMLFAQRSLKGCTLYTWPFISCSKCAAKVIQSGIIRHVAPFSDHSRFGEETQDSEQLFTSAGVEVTLVAMSGRFRSTSGTRRKEDDATQGSSKAPRSAD